MSQRHLIAGLLMYSVQLQYPFTRNVLAEGQHTYNDSHNIDRVVARGVQAGLARRAAAEADSNQRQESEYRWRTVGISALAQSATR